MAALVERTRYRGGWTRTSLAYDECITATLDALRDYWPVALRQVYYQLVAAGAMEDKLEEYKKLSRILMKARLDGLVSWEATDSRAAVPASCGAWQRHLTGTSQMNSL